MTRVEEIIARVNALRGGNPFSDEQKTIWIAVLDGLIYRELFSKTEGTDVAYSSPKELHDMLLVEPPFDEIYVLWLFAQMDLYLGEQAKYNIDITAFQDFYDNYANYYVNSNNMQKMPKILW